MNQEKTYAELEARIRELENQAALFREQERALQKTEKRWQMMLNVSLDGIAIFNQNYELVEVNKRFAEMLGYSPEELLELKVWDWDVMMDEAQIRGRFPNIITQQIFETRHRRKDGSIYDAEISASGTRVGDEPMVITIVRDITQKKLSEKLYRSILETAMDGVWRADLDGNLKEVNQALCRMTGYSETELLGLKISDLEATENKDDVNAHIQKIMQNGQDRFESRHRRQDGSVYDVEVTVQYHPEDGGQLVTFAKDISAQKRQERELNYQAMLLDQIHDHVTATDLEGRIIYVNQAVCRKLGQERRRIIGEKTDVYGENAAKGATQKEIVEETLRKGEWRGEVVNYSCEGQEMILDCRTTLITDDNDNPVSMVGISTDITERKKIAERLQQAQKLESIGSLAGGIAHDFNNILFPIIGMAELLLDRLQPASPEHDNAGQILKAGKRGADLVRQIMTFSRQSEYRASPLKLQNILDEAIKLARATIPTNIEIIQDITDDCGPVLADATQIHQVTMNIITNAYHALETRGETITLRLREIAPADEFRPDQLNPAGKFAHLSISDNGIGMTNDLLGKIFDPYFTTKGHGKGSGLGLAVAYGIIKKHQGEISVTSEPGRGTTFNILLPILENQPVSAAGPAGTKLFFGDEHILLVDDDEAVLNLEIRMLNHLGYRVTPCSDSRQALARFCENPAEFDLVVSDMAMPKMTGDQLAIELIAKRPDIPVIICTGYSEKLDQERAQAIGLKRLLIKPISVQELSAAIREALGKKNSQH